MELSVAFSLKFIEFAKRLRNGKTFDHVRVCDSNVCFILQI